MDGYPRTLAQAASFDQVLRQQFLNLTRSSFFVVDDEEIVAPAERPLESARDCKTHLPHAQQAAQVAGHLRCLRHAR